MTLDAVAIAVPGHERFCIESVTTCRWFASVMVARQNSATDAHCSPDQLHAVAAGYVYSAWD